MRQYLKYAILPIIALILIFLMVTSPASASHPSCSFPVPQAVEWLAAMDAKLLASTDEPEAVAELAKLYAAIEPVSEVEEYDFVNVYSVQGRTVVAFVHGTCVSGLTDQLTQEQITKHFGLLV